MLEYLASTMRKKLPKRVPTSSTTRARTHLVRTSKRGDDISELSKISRAYRHISQQSSTTTAYADLVLDASAARALRTCF